MKAKYILAIIFIFIGLKSGQASTQTVKALSPSAQVLLGKLYSINERERLNAAIRLANYNHPQVVNGLITIINNDKSEMVKRVALKSLGYIGDDRALSVILNCLFSDALSIKVEAMSAAVNFSTPPVREALMEQTNSSNPLIRQKAVTYLGSLEKNNERVVNVIIDRLADISEGVKIAACQVLGKKKVREAVPHLTSIVMGERSELVRGYAAKALGDIGDEESIKNLKEVLKDKSPVVRITAAKSLALMGNKTALSEAIEGIKSSDSRIRIDSCEIMGILGDEKVLILLREAADDLDRRVQKAAQEAIGKIILRNNKKN